MMFKLLILNLFFMKSFAQNEDFSPNNETVGLLLPNLLLSHARARALHDITAARLRHHLPLRTHHLLLQGTPEFLMENVTIEGITKPLENVENTANRILNQTENVIEEIIGYDNHKVPAAPTTNSKENQQINLMDEDENSKEINQLLTKLFYRILQQQKRNNTNVVFEQSQNHPDNQTNLSKGGLEFWKLIEENATPFIKINHENFDHQLDKNLLKTNQRIFEYLTEMFTNVVKMELNKKPSTVLNRKRRNATEEIHNEDNNNAVVKEEFKNRLNHLMHTMMDKIKEIISNDTIINKLYSADPNFNDDLQKEMEPFLSGAVQLFLPNDQNNHHEENNNKEMKTGSPNIENQQPEEILQSFKKHKKHRSENRKNDERLFLDSLNYFNHNDGFHARRNFERALEEKLPSSDSSRHGKGFHTHHFALSHGVEHHGSKFPNHFPTNPPPIPISNHYIPPFHSFPHPHGHQKLITSHVTINKQDNFLPAINQNHFHHRAFNDENLQRSFVIQVPRNIPVYHEIFKRSVPLLKVIADPNVKLDMPKTMENIGTVAKNSFEDDKAPMYHIRNMVGSAKNVILAALRIPPQDAVIPTQYKIMDRSDLKKSKSPEVVSRFAGDPDEDQFIQTFKRLGLMLRESVQSGQETLQHMTDVAHSARKAVVTTGHATPKFLTPYVKATAIKKDKKPEKLMLITPRIGEITNEESLPDPTDEYVKIGDLMDAFGVSNPEKNKVGLTRIVVHPKKPNRVQSRFGNDQKKKDFFIVAEHIDDDDNFDGKSSKGIKHGKGGTSLKDILGKVREDILRNSKVRDEKILGSKSEKVKEIVDKIFKFKNSDDEIPDDFDKDIEEILKFDWEKIEAIPGGGEVKELDTSKLNPIQDIDYNELYQNVVKEKKGDENVE